MFKLLYYISLRTSFYYPQGTLRSILTPALGGSVITIAQWEHQLTFTEHLLPARTMHIVTHLFLTKTLQDRPV